MASGINGFQALKVKESIKGTTGNPFFTGKLITADLLVLTSLDQLIFILKLLFSFAKKATLMRRSTVL